SAMWATFDQALKRHQQLEELLADPAVIADRTRFAQTAKEHGSLAKMVRPYQDYLKVSEDVANARALAEGESDPEMRQYAEQELAALNARQQTLQSRLEDLLLVDPGEDFASIILEIRAGTGGDEAALFAGDLYSMYTHYARDQGFKVEDISFSPGEHGGFKDVVFSITGDEVYQHLRYESGGHRVPRVPKTQAQGRIP